MSEQNKNSPQVTPTVDMMSMMDYLQKITKDKSKIDVLYELLKPENLEFITEWPNSNYTKWGVKVMTWRESVKQVFHLTEQEQETLVKVMEHQAKLKMTSHKRRRAQEIIAPLKDDNTSIYNMENKVKKSFLGLR